MNKKRYRVIWRATVVGLKSPRDRALSIKHAFTAFPAKVQVLLEDNKPHIVTLISPTGYLMYAPMTLDQLIFKKRERFEVPY